MAWIRIALAAAMIALPIAADAAELPVPKVHKAHTAKHRHVVHVTRAHFGYYFGRWGWRSGGTASSWYGSTFVLAGGPWDGPGIALKASPRGVAYIHCPARRPDACLAEPVVVPLAVAGLPVGR